MRRARGARLTADGLFRRRRASQRPYAYRRSADPLNRAALGLARRGAIAYGEADVAIDALAAFFIDLGLKPGDRIAIQLPNIAVAGVELARRLARRAHGR